MARLNILLFLICGILCARGDVHSVSLITCGPGSEIYELEGHTALRLQFDDGRDLSVNWGTFDFNSPNFLYRFVKGETDYRMAVYPFDLFLDQYARAGRRVMEQELNLTPEEMNRLAWLVDSTLTVGSPVYRYNYVKDNCATRPVDYIQSAVGGTVSLGDDTGLTPRQDTFRRDMSFYHANYPWYQFGIDLALGSGIDYKLTHREHYFAPVALARMARGAVIEKYNADSTDANPRPLVKGEAMLLPEGTGGSLPATPWYLTPLAVCWAFFGLSVIVVARDFYRHRIGRFLPCVYYSVATIAGLLLTFLIFVSVHESTSPNWLYLWLNPLCLIGALLIWLKKLKQVVFYWQILNFVAILALSVLAMAGVQRLNPAFVPLMLADALFALEWIVEIGWKRKPA